MLSILATHSLDGYVPGINNILEGYTDHTGTPIPSVAEKIEKGRVALDALATYRKFKETDPLTATTARQTLEQNVQYMGYGYLEKTEDVIPPVGIVFWAFRIMIGLGTFLLAMLILVAWFTYKDKIYHLKWLLWTALLSIPLVYLSGQAGWVVAEVGRQPWTIQGLLPVHVAISDISVGAIKTTFFLFVAVFALFLIIELRIMMAAIRKGPEVEPEK